MRKTLCVILVAATAFASRAAFAEHKLQGAVVKDIQGAAQAIVRDAAIYQRKRTLAESFRISADMKKLQKALVQHDCLKAEAQELQAASTSLRAAQVDFSPDRTTLSVNRMMVLINDLLKKDCGVSPQRVP